MKGTHQPELQIFLHVCGFRCLHSSSYPWSLRTVSFSALFLTVTFWSLCYLHSFFCWYFSMSSHILFCLLDVTYLSSVASSSNAFSFSSSSLSFFYRNILPFPLMLLLLSFFPKAQQAPNTHLWLVSSHTSYCSIKWHAVNLFWKSSTIFTNFFIFVRTSSSVFWMCSTKSELTCFGMTFSTYVTTSFTF